MINFRYHVVSLTAVFLALAIGLVVGTAALNGPVADGLRDNVNGLRKHNEQLRETVNSLTEEVKREEDFVAEAAPLLLNGACVETRILILTLPSGRDHADGVVDTLRMAGATVTGRVDIQDKYVNPDSNNDLLALAERSAQTSIPSTGLPGNSNGVETSSALLASALLDRADGSVVTEADRAAVLTAYSSGGYLTVDGKITGSAEAVVLVSGQPHVDRDSAQKDQAVVTMVVQFDRVVPFVVAGSGSSGGNVVAEIRSGELAKTVSTVDNANTFAGQVVTALAAAERVKQKKSGQYGLGAGATSLMPKLPE